MRAKARRCAYDSEMYNSLRATQGVCARVQLVYVCLVVRRPRTALRCAKATLFYGKCVPTRPPLSPPVQKHKSSLPAAITVPERYCTPYIIQIIIKCVQGRGFIADYEFLADIPVISLLDMTSSERPQHSRAVVPTGTYTRANFIMLHYPLLAFGT
jgi:hypothetical protein